MQHRSVKIIASLLLIAALLVTSVIYTEEALSLMGQMYLGWGSFAIIFLMSKTKRFSNQPWRSIFIFFALFVSCRYVAWRIVDTLHYTNFFDFIGMSLLFLAELYGFSLFLFDMFVNFSPLATKSIPLPRDHRDYPTVDVFIPTYDEPDGIVRMTATAATQINYPKDRLNIYILDDGGTHAKRHSHQHGAAAWARHYRLRRLADELGIHYLTRETNQKAKAGNINHALQHSRGDLVLILDCDQIPTKDILGNTVGQFLIDPKLFLVQTPHFFINQTPVNSNLTGIYNKPDESEMFYRKIQPAMNFWNASFFCGSAAILRRKYLMEVGGIAVKTITEDAETSLQLHSLGYNSCYINKPMVCGLSPESHADYLTQHSRWGKGMLQILMHYNPLFKKGLKFPQRLAYFTSCYSWLFGFARYIFFLAPSAFLILGLNVYSASWVEMVDFTIPYALSILVVMSYFFAGSRQLFFSEIYETVRGFRLIRELLPVLINPWKQKFVVTPKGKMNDREHLSEDAFPLFILIVINIVSIFLAAGRWFTEPMWHQNILATCAWCCLNVWLGIMSIGAFWERKQIRAFHRILCTGKVRVTFTFEAQTVDADIVDISASGIGFKVKLPFLPIVNEAVKLQTTDSYGNEYSFKGHIARAQKKGDVYYCGSQFIDDQISSPEVISFVFGDSKRWQEIWDRSAELRDSKKQLVHLTTLGFSAFIDSAPLYLRWVATSLKNFCFKFLNPMYWFYLLSGALGWLIYCCYLLVVYLIGKVEHQETRNFPRIESTEGVNIYFPRLNAFLEGNQLDISLTGVGIEAKLPFEIQDGELIQITAPGVTGHHYQFDCIVRRVIYRDGKTVLGAEFIVDNSNYSKVVSFVYGQGSKMILSLTLGNLRTILTYLFLRPQMHSRDRNVNHD